MLNNDDKSSHRLVPQLRQGTPFGLDNRFEACPALSRTLTSRKNNKGIVSIRVYMNDDIILPDK